MIKKYSIAFFKRILQFKNINPRLFNISKGFFAERYQNINQRRLEHLASIGLDISDKSVLEVGAGVGDLTNFFLDRGCKVTLTEVREKNIEIIKRRFQDINVFKHNMDNPLINDFSGSFDIIFCYGLLYHLKNPEQALEYMAKINNGLLLLETCVSYGDQEEINSIDENSEAETQSFSGTGCRPTRIWVYNQLKRHFKYVYVPLYQPNHFQFPIDWEKEPKNNQLTRSIFIASHNEIDNQLLSDALINKQLRGF